MDRFGISPERLARLLYPETMVFLGSLVATLLLISFVVRARATYRHDLAATLFFQKIDNPTLEKLARAATFMGNSLTIVILAVGIFGFCWAMGQIDAGFLIVGSLLALPLNAILKSLFDRQRPGEVGEFEEDEREKGVRMYGGPRWGFSFPSGHSMGSAAFYGCLAMMLWLLVPSMPLRIIGLTVCLTIPILCGLSRIFLGAHWLSDVVAGWTGGAIVAFAAGALYGPIAAA